MEWRCVCLVVFSIMAGNAKSQDLVFNPGGLYFHEKNTTVMLTIL